MQEKQKPPRRMVIIQSCEARNRHKRSLCLVLLAILINKLECLLRTRYYLFLHCHPILNRFLAFSPFGQKHCRTERLGAASIALCFFLLTVPLHRPQDAGNGEKISAANAAVISRWNRVRGLYGVP